MLYTQMPWRIVYHDQSLSFLHVWAPGDLLDAELQIRAID
jgi:hypothetical protein